MLKHLPNLLTLMRLLLAPAIAWTVLLAFAEPEGTQRASDPGFARAEVWAMVAAGLYVLAALTDLFDGMAARILKAESKFGRLLDPIADKALVALPLIALSLVAARLSWPLLPVIVGAAAVIIVRDASITLLRFTARDGEGVRVSPLAKVKTALELVAVGAPIVLAALAAMLRRMSLDASAALSPGVLTAWAILLGVAAVLSAYTAAQYLLARRASLG